MQAVFLALIQQLNASIFTLVAMLLVMFWIVYKSGGWVKSYKDFEDKNIKVEIKMDMIKESIFKIQATTDLLYQAHLTTVKSHSPISLTPKGDEVAKAISAEEKIKDHWEEIKRIVDKKSPKNPYDVQTVSLDISRDCFDKIFTEKEQSEIKTYAYSIGMNILEIYPILGVMIRDRIFKENGTKAEEVDKHNPIISQ